MCSENALPPFQNELPVKSMDVSETGFRERYQTALTGKNRARNKQGEGDLNAPMVRKSAIISKPRNMRLDLATR